MSALSGKRQLAASVQRGRLRPGFTGAVRWRDPSPPPGGRPCEVEGRFRDGRLVGIEAKSLGLGYSYERPLPTRATLLAGLHRALAERKGASRG